MDKNDPKIDRVRYWGNVVNFWVGVAFLCVGLFFYFFPLQAAKFWSAGGSIDPGLAEASFTATGIAMAALAAVLIWVGELDRRRQLHGN